MKKIIVTELKKQYERVTVGPCSFSVPEGKTLAVIEGLLCVWRSQIC